MIIKVCGLRDADNIRAVEEAGADWTGFIFYPRSPRFVSEVPTYLPQHAKRVGVFVHPQFRDVVEKVKAFGLQAVQFHGTASPDMCQTFRERGLTVIRALPATDDFVAETAEYTHKIDYFLFDHTYTQVWGQRQTIRLEPSATLPWANPLLTERWPFAPISRSIAPLSPPHVSRLRP